MATNYYCPPELRLQPYLDSTTTAFDTIFNYSISTTLANGTTSSLSNTITFSTDATYTVTSATTTSDHDDSSTLSHNFTKVTFLHASTFCVANSERLSASARSQPCLSGNLTLTSMTRAKQTASTSLPPFAPANSHSSRTLKGWIHCRFPFGSFCIKD